MANPAPHDDIPATALAWHRGQGAAIATVIETWGSAPRPAGSQLAIAADGSIAGSVSGGCVEGAVVAEATDCMRSGTPRILEFGVSDDEAFAVGLACGGRIRVLVEPTGAEPGMPEKLLTQLVQLRAEKVPVAVRTHIRNWERQLVVGAGAAPEIRKRLTADRSGMDGDWFTAVHNPPLRMLVVGGVHIAQPLLAMARNAGYETVLIDPREAFASGDRFPGELILHDWPDEAIQALVPDRRTAVVTLTHDPKLDDPAIIAALETEAFYIGSLGSVRTHEKRISRLSEQGIGLDGIGRVCAPVGLDIGARTPAEIAIAILAEVTEALRRPRERA
ncbi:MAG: XdhC family protein [Rhodobacteraceae bacterium]|nr:XdhC family protein [Paracoccaceae bacterium]